MKTKLLLIALIIVSIFTMNAFAQKKDKDKGKDKSKEKVKVQIIGLPSLININETTEFTVRITNKSKKEDFSTDGLTFDTRGALTVYPASVGSFIIPPGENIELKFKLSAPSNVGKGKFRITFYNDGKKAGTKTKNIRVVDGNIKSKEYNDDDDDDDGKDYDDDGKGNKEKKENDND